LFIYHIDHLEVLVDQSPHFIYHLDHLELVETAGFLLAAGHVTKIILTTVHNYHVATISTSFSW